MLGAAELVHAKPRTVEVCTDAAARAAACGVPVAWPRPRQVSCDPRPAELLASLLMRTWGLPMAAHLWARRKAPSIDIILVTILQLGEHHMGNTHPNRGPATA